MINNQDQDIDYEVGEPELTEEVCSECKSKSVYVEYQANGPDDYTRTWTCKECGATQSE